MLRCATCHGRQKQEGGLDVRSRASLLKGGKSGPALVLGQPDQSLVVKRIHAGEMPPKKQLAAASVKPVEAGELEKLRRWIADGAPELECVPTCRMANLMRWSRTPTGSSGRFNRRATSTFRSKRRRPHPNRAASTRSMRSSLRNFASINSHSLPPPIPRRSPAVCRSTCSDFRRLRICWRRFTADDSPGAYERLVDELLASPRYGERWAQYWLDVAGYSDSEGVQDSDLLRPASYRYRDYVIRAFNSDKPYDRFLWEQLAGDELADYEHGAVDHAGALRQPGGDRIPADDRGRNVRQTSPASSRIGWTSSTIN